MADSLAGVRLTTYGHSGIFTIISPSFTNILTSLEFFDKVGFQKHSVTCYDLFDHSRILLNLLGTYLETDQCVAEKCLVRNTPSLSQAVGWGKAGQ